MSDRTESGDLFNHVESLFGASLTQEEIEQVRERVEEHMAGIAAMRSVPLKNEDEPYFVFGPLDGGRAP